MTPPKVKGVRKKYNCWCGFSSDTIKDYRHEHLEKKTMTPKPEQCKCGHIAGVHGCGQTKRCMPCMTKGVYCKEYRPIKPKRRKVKK